MWDIYIHTLDIVENKNKNAVVKQISPSQILSLLVIRTNKEHIHIKKYGGEVEKEIYSPIKGGWRRWKVGKITKHYTFR